MSFLDILFVHNYLLSALRNDKTATRGRIPCNTIKKTEKAARWRELSPQVCFIFFRFLFIFRLEFNEKSLWKWKFSWWTADSISLYVFHLNASKNWWKRYLYFICICWSDPNCLLGWRIFLLKVFFFLQFISFIFINISFRSINTKFKFHFQHSI